MSCESSWRLSRRPTPPPLLLGSRGTSAREGAHPQATAGISRQVGGSTRTASRSSASTIRAGNGSELKIARLRWSAALKSGGLPGCSNKKSSDRHHGKPFSKNVKLMLLIFCRSEMSRMQNEQHLVCVCVCVCVCVWWCFFFAV